MDKTIDILVVEPGKAPRPARVEHTLENLQDIVGGQIELGCFLPQRVLLICNENGKSLGLTPNRRNPGTEDYIAGTFLLCGFEGEGFGSLTAEQQQEFQRLFAKPGELRRISPHEYRTVSHDSLVISNNLWRWCSRGIGGKTALDYLVHVREMPFVDAVRLLNDGRDPPSLFQPVKKPAPPSQPFCLPEARRFAPHVVAYLQGRGIDPAIIGKCLENGNLYESRQYQNCVFVGKNREGIPMSASLRGTSGDFKGDVPGSDKRFGFALNGSDSHTLLVFESAIDALSCATIDKWNHAPKSHYLALGGTSPLAVVQYLTDHPNVDTVRLRLDNDKAGLCGIAGIETAIRMEAVFSHVKIIPEPPPKECGKDYNELLNVRLAERHHPPCNRNLER